MAVSRKFIALAKQTNCSGKKEPTPLDDVAAGVRANVFTVHLAYGNKKSVLLNPVEPLRVVLEKICVTRNMKLDECVPIDTSGNPVPLTTKLGEIPGWEITFTEKATEATSKLLLPPFIDDLIREGLAIETVQTRGRSKSTGSKVKSIVMRKDEEKMKKKSALYEQYEFLNVLGNGAFSVVHLAKNKQTGQEVAIKILSKDTMQNKQSSSSKKFQREIKIMKSLNHRHIVKFYELDEDKHNYYVVMEMVNGGELFDRIVESGRLTEKFSSRILRQVLLAIQYMHEVGICHRDLKPENVLFVDTTYREVKIADFGESQSFMENKLTTYCGTPDYMPPEIIQSQEHGPPADMWSVGVLCYVMVGGFVPFDGGDNTELFANIEAAKYSFPLPEWDEKTDLTKKFISSLLKIDPSV